MDRGGGGMVESEEFSLGISLRCLLHIQVEKSGR